MPELESAALFVVFFLLGLVQAAPSVTTGDAGEFAACAATLGVAHAPGFPAYVLLGKAFGTLVALGSWAYRLNVLSAALAAATLALFADALRRLGTGRAARLGAAAVLGLAPLWREQGAVTEVFPLALLAAAALLWVLAADGPPAALGLVFGLGLGAHQTLVLIVPALLLSGRSRDRGLPRALAAAALGAAVGFSIHLAIPLRAAASPPLDWDHAVAPAAFWRLLTRKDYGSLALTTEGGQTAGVELLAAEAWRSARGLAGQLGALGTALALLGAALWKRAGLRWTAASAWAWVLAAGPLFLMLGRPPFDAQTSGALERFSLLPLLGAGLFVAAALEALSRARPLAGTAAATAAALALAPGAAAQSRRGDFLAHDYGRALLRELAPGAALVMDGGDDTFYSLAFLVDAQGLRADLALYDRGGVVFHDPYGADFRRLPKELKEDRRRSVEGSLAAEGRLWYSTLNPGLLPGWELVPAGLLRRPVKPGAGAAPPGAAFAAGAALAATLNAPRAPSAALRYRDRALAAFDPYQRGLAAFAAGRLAEGASELELAALAAPDALWTLPAVSYALAVAGYRASARGDLAGAELCYRAQSRVVPASAEPLLNLGVVLERAGRRAEAEAAEREAARREPRSARAWQTLGVLLWHEGRWPECAQAYATAAALAPGDASLARWAAQARARGAAR